MGKLFGITLLCLIVVGVFGSLAEPVSVESTTAVTIFYEDFEGAWPGEWYCVDEDPSSGEDYWGDSNYRACAGNWSGYCADESDVAGQYYDNNMFAKMYRAVSLGSYDSATLSYYYWLNSETGYDYLKVGYYDSVDSSWHRPKSYSGNSGGWVYDSLAIPTTATWVGFLFESDVGVTSEGAYVDEVYLTAEGTPTPPPILISPGTPSEPGEVIDTLTPTFYWESVSSADYYGLYISQSPYGPGNLVFDSEVDYGPLYGTSFTLPSGFLVEGEKYRWNMRSHSSSTGWGDSFSSRLYFTTGCSLPPPPTHVSPSNGATGLSITPTFQWGSVSGADYYGLYIRDITGGEGPLVFDSEVDYGPIYGTSFTLPSGILSCENNYRWNMRSHNSCGWGTDFSTGWTFSTETCPCPLPPPPTHVSPSNGATGLSITPTFQWDGVPGADYYGLYIRDITGGEGPLVFDSEVDYGPTYGTSFTLPSGFLSEGRDYRWNMRSHSSCGWGTDFSTGWSFTTKAEDAFNYRYQYVLDLAKLRDEEKPALSYVMKYAREYQISPALIMAIIRQESDFDPNARGDFWSGEYHSFGYMQVSYGAATDTYKEYAGDEYKGTKEEWKEDGLDSETNIKYGTRYLRIQHDRIKDGCLGYEDVYGDILTQTR